MDPTGLVVIPPSDPGARRDYDIALKYLFRDPDYRKVWSDLEKSRETYHITIVHNVPFGVDHDGYDHDTKEILWDPHSAQYVYTPGSTDGGRQSPALGLGHELDHAWADNRNHNQYLKDLNTPDSDFENKEEKRAIDRRERRFAERFGESPRHDHNGNFYPVGSPINRYH